jgi:hypothetical protein
MKTNDVLRKLSLNAAKNWHQNKGAKRLDSMSVGIAPLLQNSRGPERPPHKKMGGLLAAQVIAPDRTELQAEFPAIGGIHGNCGQAQGDGENSGDRK